MTKEQLQSIKLKPVADVYLSDHVRVTIYKDMFDLYGIQMYTRTRGIFPEKEETAWAYDGRWYQDWEEYLAVMEKVEYIDPYEDDSWF